LKQSISLRNIGKFSPAELLVTHLGTYTACWWGAVHFQVGTNYWPRLYITYR